MERRWLIHHEDGSQYGPATTFELARAVRSGLVSPRERVSPMDSPRDVRPIGAFREIERAVAELSVPETDEGEEALRTLIAHPADLALPAHEEATPDSEPSTLIAPSPFEDAESVGVHGGGGRRELEVPTAPEPLFVVPAGNSPFTPPPRPAAGRRPSMPDDMPRDPALAATMLAPVPLPPAAGAVVSPRRESRTRAGVRVRSEMAARHRLYLFVAFAFGLAGGLIVLTIVYIAIGR